MISAIVCTYNRERFLKDCLDSLFDQTLDRSEFEIIIVNNNSTDRTDQICQEFLSRASSHGFTLEDILENLENRKNR